MAKITITIPDELVKRVEDAYAKVYGYGEADGTKSEFVKDKLIAELKGIVKRNETDEVRVTTETTIDTDLAGIE
jgi:metal-responsive CopG/Arc/MetJ family transcriptional regulator